MTDLLPITIEDFDYTAWHVQHIARHGVTIAEVIEVLESGYAVTPAKLGRYKVIGVTNTSRCLAIIFAPARGASRYELVTARTADRAERHDYITFKLGGEK